MTVRIKLHTTLETEVEIDEDVIAEICRIEEINPEDVEEEDMITAAWEIADDYHMWDNVSDYEEVIYY